jgi:hypothetical protein
VSTIRINLHIKQAVSPRLYEALRQIKGRARAERIRSLAERMLSIECGETVPAAQRRSTGTTINAADFANDDFAKSFGYEA